MFDAQTELFTLQLNYELLLSDMQTLGFMLNICKLKHTTIIFLNQLTPEEYKLISAQCFSISGSASVKLLSCLFAKCLSLFIMAAGDPLS